MKINLNEPMTWREFKALEKEEQHDYLQNLIDTYGANAVSFAKMFHVSANTVRKHITEKDLGIKLSRGSRVDTARWNEFLGGQETEAEEVLTPSDTQPVSSRMQVYSATMRFCGAIDVDAIAAELKRVFDGTAQGEVEISFRLNCSDKQDD